MLFCAPRWNTIDPTMCKHCMCSHVTADLLHTFRGRQETVYICNWCRIFNVYTKNSWRNLETYCQRLHEYITWICHISLTICTRVFLLACDRKVMCLRVFLHNIIPSMKYTERKYGIPHTHTGAQTFNTYVVNNTYSMAYLKWEILVHIFLRYIVYSNAISFEMVSAH